MNQRAFVDQGRIVRSRSPRYSIRRIGVLLIALITWFLTNPANTDFISRIAGRKIGRKDELKSSSWPPIYKRRLTNYGIYSLEKRLSGVTVLALSQSVPLCRYDSDEFGSICEKIATSLCHEKPILDSSDRPYTACRILCLLLIGSWLLSKLETNSSKYTIEGPSFGNNILAFAMRTVLQQPFLLADLMDVNIFLYRTFVSVDRLVSKPSFKGDASWSFYLVAILLVFGIGGFSNWFAMSLTRDRVYGIRAAVAASLGCQQAMKSKELLRLFGYALSPASIFWSNIAILCVTSSPGSVVAYICGGVMGNMLGQQLFDQLNLWDMLWF